MLRLVFGRTALPVGKRANRARKCANRSYMDSATSSTNSYRRSRPAPSSGNSPNAAGAAGPEKHTFVSSHYRFDDEHVERFLARRNIHFQQYGDSLKMQCPWCPADRNRSSYRLLISKENGSFSCSSCGMNGSWCVPGSPHDFFVLPTRFGPVRPEPDNVPITARKLKIMSLNVVNFNFFDGHEANFSMRFKLELRVVPPGLDLRVYLMKTAIFHFSYNILPSHSSYILIIFHLSLAGKTFSRRFVPL